MNEITGRDLIDAPVAMCDVADAEVQADAELAAVAKDIREALIEGVDVFATARYDPSDPRMDWETALGHAVDLLMAGKIPHVKVGM